MNEGGPDARQRVWPRPVRAFHWSLAAATLLAWLTADGWRDVHEPLGYAVLALVAWRVVYGLIGPAPVRFARFVRCPAVVIGYLRDVVSGTARRHLGHNPAGGAMIVALLTGLIVCSITGWMYTLDAFWGVEWVEEFHEISAHAVLLLLPLHVVGVLVAGRSHRENLVRAMIDGMKRPPVGDDVEA